MIELVFVIIILGIISFFIAPSFERDNLALAFEQVKNHIELTQQLALDSDFYISDGNFSNQDGNAARKDARLWFKKHWQIQFHTNDSYSVYSDTSSNGSATNNSQFNASLDFSDDLVAQDPLSKLFLSGFLPATTDRVPEELRYKDSQLPETYGVTIAMDTCVFSSGTTTSDRILFDYLGRPYCHMAAAYDENDGVYGRLSTTQIRVVLTLDGVTRNICVEPKSGYIHEC